MMTFPGLIFVQALATTRVHTPQHLYSGPVLQLSTLDGEDRCPTAVQNEWCDVGKTFDTEMMPHAEMKAEGS